MLAYSKYFYNSQSKGSFQSARKIIPLVLEYIHPRSVIDIGCGIGTWLLFFEEKGINDYIGIDGNYVPPILG